MLNSWWAYPDFVYDPVRKRAHVTGCTRGGAVKVAWFDLLSKSFGQKVISEERHLADDHYTRSLIIQDGKVPISGGAYHDRDALFRVVRGKSYGEWDMLESENNVTPGTVNVAYGQFIGPSPSAANTIGTFFRGGDSNNYFMKSTDYGVTWSGVTPVRFHDKPYMLHRRNGNIGHFLSVDHPTDAVPQVRYFKIALSNGGGSPKNAAGSGILGAGFTGTDIWNFVAPDSTTAMVAAGTDLVKQAATGKSQRVLDMTRNARQIIIAHYEDKNDLGSGAVYKVLVRQTADTSNTWNEETLTSSGPAFMTASGYVGGACFASDGSINLIVNALNGSKTVQRWVRNGADFGPGTWYLDKILYEAPQGVLFLGRPRSAIDCANQNALVPGMVTFGEYHYYNPASFLDFYGDQILVEY